MDADANPIEKVREPVAYAAERGVPVEDAFPRGADDGPWAIGRDAEGRVTLDGVPVEPDCLLVQLLRERPGTPISEG